MSTSTTVYIVQSLIMEVDVVVKTPIHAFTCQKKAYDLRNSLYEHEQKKEQCFYELADLGNVDFEERESVLKKYDLQPQDMEVMYFGDISFEVVSVSLD